MIREIRISHFKRFEADEVIDVSGDVVLLAGPNNSGKSTVLQALAAWNLALQRWLAERGERQSSKRISLTVDEFTAVPVREMNLLWCNRRTADARRTEQGKQTTKARPIVITVVGVDLEGAQWSLAIELLYANQKLVYARPVDPNHPDGPTPIIPVQAKQMQVVHIPPFSGLETEEPFRDPGLRDRLIGQGRPGEIVRNLLWELWRQNDKRPWEALVKDIEDLFGYTLLSPVYYATRQAYIVSEYRPRTKSGAPAAKLDIASAGSGFHQVLLLLACFYAKPATVLLLDEPDAHLHFILQGEVFNRLRAVAAERRCQLIVATHAEALLDDTEPTGILSFFKKPHRLQTRGQVQDLRSALHRLSSTDLLQADHVGAVLYLEDDSDARLLGEWASLLQHPAARFFKFPYIYAMGGAGELSEAKRHFSVLGLAFPNIRGLCLLDRDRSTGPQAQDFPGGLRLLRWNRYEIENYLLNPWVIKRFLEQNYLVPPTDPDQLALPTIAPEIIERDQAVVDQEFTRQGLAGLDYLSDDIQILRDLKASELLVFILGKTFRQLPKRDLFLIARVMHPEEIHPEIIEKLDEIAGILPVPEAPNNPGENHDGDALDEEG
jgi:predicted ATPase